MKYKTCFLLACLACFCNLSFAENSIPAEAPNPSGETINAPEAPSSEDGTADAPGTSAPKGNAETTPGAPDPTNEPVETPATADETAGTNADDTAAAGAETNQATQTEDAPTSVLTATLGYDFSVGKYGGPDKTFYRSIPLDISYETNEYGLEMTIPYISITSPVGSVVAQDVVVVSQPGQPAAMQTQSGLGDIWVGGTYYFLNESENAPLLDIKTRLKLPTASVAKGLGTGKADLSIQLDRRQTYGKLTVALSGGYIRNGRIAALALRNTWFASGDISREFAEGHTAGAMLYGQQAIADGTPHQAELMFYWSYKPTAKSPLTARLYLLKGLAQGSADYGTGLSCALSF